MRLRIAPPEMNSGSSVVRFAQLVAASKAGMREILEKVIQLPDAHGHLDGCIDVEAARQHGRLIGDDSHAAPTQPGKAHLCSTACRAAVQQQHLPCSSI